MKSLLLKLLVSAAVAAALSAPTRAALIVNGGFESSFTGWTRADQVGSAGTFTTQTGTSSPVNGFSVPAPPAGSFAAMSDAEGPGTHILYQDFTVAGGLTSYALQFSLFVNNTAGTFFTPNTLDFATPALNQRFRVDIMGNAANPFSLAAGDILQTLFETTPGSVPVSGYTPLSFDVTSLFQANQGATLRLRFAQVDNVAPFNIGLDNVDVRIGGTATVPDTLPGATVALAFFGVLLAGAIHRRRAAVTVRST